MALESLRARVLREFGGGEASADAPDSGGKEEDSGASLHTAQAARAAPHVDLIALPHVRVRMVWRRRVAVPRAHARVCSLRLPPSRGARPCCGRRLEGSRLEARDPRRLPRSQLSHGTLRSSSLSSDRYLEEASKVEPAAAERRYYHGRPRQGRRGRRRRLSTCSGGIGAGTRCVA